MGKKTQKKGFTLIIVLILVALLILAPFAASSIMGSTFGSHAREGTPAEGKDSAIIPYFPAGVCGVGYEGEPASCGWIQLPNDSSYYQKYNTPGEDWGKPALVNMLIAVAQSWQSTGKPKIQIGDLSGKCRQAGGHASHDRGIDVDIDLPGGMMVDGSRYNPQLAIDLAKEFITCGATDIGYEDPQVLQTVNAWASENGYPGRIKDWSGHADHFHVRIENR